MEEDALTLKICLCGQYGTGKTSIRRRYMGDSRFRRNYIPTVGSDFSYKEIRHNKGTIRLLIWDIAGEPKFRQFRSLYFQGSHGALVVFDVKNRSSFDNLKVWINDLETYTNTGKVPFLIIGNKSDLIMTEGEMEVSPSEVDEFIAELQEKYSNEFQIKFVQTSALLGKNIDEAFEQLIAEIIDWLPNRKIIA